MTDINTTIMTGRLVDDPDLIGKNGDVMKFRLAVNREVKDGDSWKSEASFFNWTRFKTSEKFAALFHKGDKVTVKGIATISDTESKKFKDKNGNPATYKTVEFICDKFDGISIPDKKADQMQTEAPKPQKPTPSAKGPEEFEDDDIPF